MTFNLFGIPTNFNNALWSLPVEMQFYLLFPITIFLLNFRRKFSYILVVGFVGSLYLLNHILHLNIEFLARSWEFVGGILLGAYWREISDFTGRTWARVIGIIAALCLFELARFGIVIRHFVPSNFFGVVFCFIIVAVSLGFAEWKAQSGFGHFFVNIGLWSYSLYLIHNLIIGALSPLLRSLELRPLVYFITMFSMVYVLAVVTSRFIYNHFERPFIYLGARYTSPKSSEVSPRGSSVT